MRRILSVCVLIALVAASAKASTITGKLIDLDPTLTAPGSVHRIQVLLQSDQPNGISGVGFDVIATNAAGAGTTQGLAFPGGAANTTYNSVFAADGYASIKPAATIPNSANYDANNAFPKPVMGVDGAGAASAIGGSFSATPGSVDSDPADGSVFGASGAFELVATEKWTVNGTGYLSLYLTGPQFFADKTGNVFGNYTTVAVSNHDLNSSNGLLVSVPEPASFVLMGLAGLGLAAVARRRRS